MTLTRKPATLLALLAVVLIVATGASWALASGGGSDQIYACVNPAGQPRIVDSADECKKKETSLAWNIVGPAGLPGAPGADGVDGADGLPGAPGSDGADGADGADGLPGAPGSDGADGADGADGLPGAPGSDGADGADGADGLPGADGADGLACWDLNGDGIDDPGEDANGDGVWDALDCQGPQGDPGIPGLPGDPGPACWDLNGDGIDDPGEDANGDGVWDALDCQGPQGLPGPGLPMDCDAGDFVRWDGTQWACVSDWPAPTPILRTLATSSTHSSVAIGTDGLPVISYYNRNFVDNLRVAHCDDATCSSATHTTVDSPGDVGILSSMTIGDDGLPVISYLDFDNRDLKVAHCDDATCSGATVTTADGSDDVGHFSSIAIGTDGFPIISYYDNTHGNLKVAHCNDVACLSASVTTVDSAYHAAPSSIAFGADGLPIIHYLDTYTNPYLRVAYCADAACSATRYIRTIRHGGGDNEKAYWSSMTIGTDGLPVISYFEVNDSDLKVAHCNDASCSWSSQVTLDSAGSVGDACSIAIDADGLPIISYHDSTNGVVKVARCDDAACSSASWTFLDGSPDAHNNGTTSVAIGADGRPIISYGLREPDVFFGDLKVAILPY